MAVVIRIKLPLPSKFYCDVCHPEDIRPTGQKLKGAYVTHYALKKHYKDKHLKDSVVQFECRCGSIFQQLREGNKHLRSCVTTAAPQLPTPEVNDPTPPDRIQHNAVPTVQRETAAVPTVQRETAAVLTVQQVTAAVPTVQRETAASPTVQRVTAAVPTVQQVTAAVPTVQQVTAAVPTVRRVTTAVPTVQRVTARRSRIPTALRGRPNRRMDTEGRQLVLLSADDSISRGSRIPCPTTTAGACQRRQYTRTRPATRDAATQTHARDQSRSHALATQWNDRFDSVSTPAALEQTLKALILSVLQTQTTATTSRTPNGSSSNNEARALQQLYRHDPKKAMEQVRNGADMRCMISKATLFNHFQNIYAPNNTRTNAMPSSVPKLPPADTGNPFNTPMTAAFVASRLALVSNTAPGPDRIRYAHWKKIDPSCSTFASIFNAVLRLRYMPQAWKESVTILIHKKGLAADVTNWRPIALSNTLGKLFSSCIAVLLMDWSIRNNRLSTAQKGFLKYEGCLEHNFVLQSIINDARRRSKTTAFAWLDFRNAFGSVPHDTIDDTLVWAGLDDDAVSIIKLLYVGCTTRIRSCEGTTDPIRIQSGVRQGCPLSPILFDLVMEPLIRAVASTDQGYTLNGTKIDVLAYADDLALISKSPAGLRRQLDTASEVARWAGLQFNATKCASLHIGRGHCILTPFYIQGEEMVITEKSGLYRHLGIATGYTYGPTGADIITNMSEDVQNIDNSLLAPWQKFDAIRMFVIPKITFQLKGGRTARQPLQDLDSMIKKKAKGWLNLPDRSSNEILYLPHKSGGMNLIPLKTLADICDVVQAVHLLSSRDPQITQVAHSTIHEVVKQRVKAAPSPDQVEQYLNGATDGVFAGKFFSHSSNWTRLRISTRQLRKRIPLEWRCSDNGIKAYIKDTQLTTKNAEIQLKAAYRTHLAQVLASKPDQGKVFTVAEKSSASNHYVGSGNFTRFAAWRFIFRARLNVLPLRGCLKFAIGTKQCRKCNYVSETLPHVINHCDVHMTAMTKRHDAVVNRLLKAFNPKNNVRVLTNQTVPECDSSLRPDILILDDRSKIATIIDVAIPFENRYAAFEEARTRKRQKYDGIAEHLKNRGYKVFNDAFVIGSLGSYDPANEPCIRRLRIPHKYATLMKRLMVCDVIRWSRDIYVEHVTGIRQYEEAETAAAT